MRRIAVDIARPLADEPGTGHNRWHPGIAPIARVPPGEEIVLETRDGADGQLPPGSTGEHLARMRFGRSHPLTGPVFVEGAEPGDLLEVEILGFETPAAGVTGFVPGFGLLADVFTEPYALTWELDGAVARSEALPGVAVPAAPFPGVIGIAPSPERMARVRDRERELAARGGAVAPDEPDDAWPPEARDGLRTLPPREGGGNVDIPQLVAGSRLLVTVEVPGALFSVGDLHYAQGEGEVCGSAIEITGAVRVRFRLREDLVGWRPRFPAFETPPRRERACFATTGIPLTDDGRNESLDVGLAARRAVLEMIDWLQAVHGFDRRAAYALCSAAVDLRISEAVDAPNPLVSALLPLDVFAD